MNRCMLVFDTLYIEYNGDVHFCCISKESFGNIRNANLEDLWNNDKAKQLRQNILSGDYSACSSQCPMVVEKNLLVQNGSYSYEIWSGPTDSLINNIKHLHITAGLNCNQRCSFCYQKDYKAELDEIIYKEKLLPIYPQLATLTIQGGEPTYLKSCKEILHIIDKKAPKVKIIMPTNGKNFDNFWQDFMVRKGHMVNFSINASNKETYDKLVKGGDWDKVINNLQSFLKKHDENKSKCSIRCSFVVIEENIDDVYNFATFINNIGKIDEIFYLLNESSTWKEDLHRYDVIKIVTAIANFEKISNTFDNAPSVITFKQIFHEEIKWRAEVVIKYQPLKNQLIASENQLIALKNQLIALKNQLITLKNQLIALKNQLIASENQLIAKNRLIALENRLIQEMENRLIALENRLIALENRLIQELEILLNSRSWRMTKPLRYIKRRLKKLLPQEEKPLVHSAEEVLGMIGLLRNSISWEMTAPVRAVKKTLSRIGKFIAVRHSN